MDNNNQYRQQYPPYQPQPNYQYPPQPPYSPYAEPAKDLATASLVMGILSLVCCGNSIFTILGIVFAAIAKSKGNRSTTATVGLVLSIISLALSIISLLWLFAFGGLEAYENLLREFFYNLQ